MSIFLHYLLLGIETRGTFAIYSQRQRRPTCEIPFRHAIEQQPRSKATNISRCPTCDDRRLIVCDAVSRSLVRSFVRAFNWRWRRFTSLSLHLGPHWEKEPPIQEAEVAAVERREKKRNKTRIIYRKRARPTWQRVIQCCSVHFALPGSALQLPEWLSHTSREAVTGLISIAGLNFRTIWRPHA